MAPTDRARENHEVLFPNHVSTLATTDPELIEIFDNFAFDEVLQGSTLDSRTRLMVQLAAIIASQALREYRAMLGRRNAISSPCSPRSTQTRQAGWTPCATSRTCRYPRSRSGCAMTLNR